MRIVSLHLRNFKRFTELNIDSIPDTSKLVLLIGSNGSGKSSVFDAFDYIKKPYKGYSNSIKEYYNKNNQPATVIATFGDKSFFTVNDLQVIEGSQEIAEKFYGRSSIRIVPRISNNANPDQISKNTDAPLTFIDSDTRFTNDLFMYMQQIDNALREPVFKGQSADTLKIFKDFIQPLNSSLINIFSGDATTTIQIAEFESATSNSTGRLIFNKGNSKINYDLLSHGEKQVVILLLNFIVRKKYFKDSIIFIDEMDCHLNTSLQYRLLEEIVNVWIPDEAQLWTASHALGFIDFAKKSSTATIIDLNLLNFDVPQTLKPEPKESLQVFDIAIPKEILQHILKGSKPVVVENKNDEFYNLALAERGYLFLPATNSREVFLTIKGDKSMLGLRDKDYLKPEEIKEIKAKYPNLKVLGYYSFENYIYHPDNIFEINSKGYSREEYIKEITAAKNLHLLSIVGELGVSRQTYVEFKEGIKNDGVIEAIIDDLTSNELERFYCYFSIKKYYNKQYLQQFALTPKILVQTNWFKTKVEELLIR